jgi:hypothetical protein
LTRGYLPGILGTVKTTVDIPDGMLQELLRYTAASTKRDAILAAIGEFNERRRMAELTSLLGTFRDFMDRDDLDRARGDD